MKPKNSADLINMYKNMPEAQLQEEIDSLFDMAYAMLEATESNSIEIFPNPNVRLSFRCDVLQDESKYVC